MTESKRNRGMSAASRVTALASSVMDLHVRIALQEMDKEKRRLISGIIFLATGGVLMIFALLATEIVLGIWIEENLELNIFFILSTLAILNLILAGVSLRIGGYLAKGPYLPETLEGLSKTTKAVLGK
tara:strand:- start:5468 stop:5851 length:384 start_codon:yes stop_codon:yes gene_type:complete